MNKRIKEQVETKRDIRKRILNLLENQKEEDRLLKSKIIFSKLIETPEFNRANIILFYASFDGEVETYSMMKQTITLGKKIALPIVIRDQKKILPSLVEDLDRELEKGPYGIPQPRSEYFRRIPVNNTVAVIVPGVAFDKHHNRLGRGLGYYDRFLAGLPDTVPTIGLAFDFQILDCVPHQKKHDVPVHRVISN